VGQLQQVEVLELQQLVQQEVFLTQLLLLCYRYLWQAVKQELLEAQEVTLVHQ
jgi:hypothetical protein